MSQQTTPAEQKSFQRKKPPFRADQVGSLLRSEPVKKARLQKRPAILRLSSFARSKTMKSSALWRNRRKPA